MDTVELKASWDRFYAELWDRYCPRPPSDYTALELGAYIDQMPIEIKMEEGDVEEEGDEEEERGYLREGLFHHWLTCWRKAQEN